jgi:hypothetical protein
MGPDTFPDRSRGGDGIIATLFDWKGIEEVFHSRVRGIHGGSLWLEPSFHGLQWPHNTRTGIGVSGMFWVDSGYETITRGLAVPPTPNSSMFVDQGRGVLRVTPTYVSDRFFIQGQAELVGNLCQGAADAAGICPYAGTFSTDDLWIRLGHWNIWDLQVGRFQGWEIYHLGMGMDPYTLERMGALMAGVDSGLNPKLEAPSLYGVNYMHDRAADGLAVGYAALHGYVTNYLRFELLTKEGTNKSIATNADSGGTAYNYLGLRPAAIFDIGWFKLKAGAEWQKRTATTQTLEPGTPPTKKAPTEDRVNEGIGAAMQFVLDPYVEFGLNAAIGKQHETDTMAREVPENSYTTKSVGGFANLRLADGLLAGVGANWTEQLDLYLAANSNANNYTSHLQGFVAFQYLLAGQLYIKAVFGLAKAGFQPSDLTVQSWNNYMYGGNLGPIPLPSIRIRLMYLY